MKTRWAWWTGLALSLALTDAARGQSAAPAWSFGGGQPGAHLGYSVGSAGDVNGDGYSDLLVGAPDADSGERDEGSAYLFLGSPAGLARSPAWTLEGDQSGAQLGFCVASAGDINGDGYADVLVGAPGYDGGQEDEGAVFIYLGSPGGLAPTPSGVWQGDQVGSRFGSSVASAGDVNADGFDDVLIGAPEHDGGEIDEGAAFLFLGTPSGSPSTAAWSAESNQAGASFGSSVAALGDMNGDGFGDVVIGAPLFDNGQVDEGQARVFAGSASGLATIPLQSFEQNGADSRFASCVAGGGDLTGDGVRRILFGAPTYVYTHPGEGGTFMAFLGQTPFFLDFGRQAFARRGISIASAGDVNGDGRMDVVIGADLYDNGEQDEGVVTLHLGHPSFVVDRTPAWTVDVDQPSCGFGFSVASAGDVNGDGYADVVAGAPLYDQGSGDEGRAFVYLGPSGTVTGIEAEPEALASPAIRRVGPNPFRTSIKLVYAMPRAGRVHLSVVDVLGRQRAVLVNEEQGPGRHLLTWSGHDRSGVDCAAGIYFVRLDVEGSVTVRRVLRMK